MPIQPNCPTAGKTETERGLQRREAVTSASSSGTCGSLPRSGCVGFVTRRRRGTRGARHAHMPHGSYAPPGGSSALVVPEIHPVFARVRCDWPRSGHMGLAMRRRRIASSGHTPPRFICVFWRLDRIIRWSRASCSCRSHEQNPKKTRLPRSGTEVRRQ